MKRILINATHNEEIRVALCKDHHLYDFDLENRTREQKKSNIYKGHITRVEPSLEAVFVEYGSTRQGFLPLREIAPEYLAGNPREDNIKKLIKEGDELIVQVEKEERGNKGAALSTYISLAGRYLVLMPNNSKGGGISRQISGKVRDEMKQIIASLNVPRGMSVIVRTAGIGKTLKDLQTDLDHLLDIWASIQKQNHERKSPCLVHQEAGVVTRAVRDYLRDDIGEVWIDSEHAYNEAASFIAAVMPNQMKKLRKYTDFEPMFAAFGIERQIESAYQREVRLPSGGSIVIDQTEAMVAIDINSSKSTKGSDVAETAYHTNLEAADEIARQLRLRDMGGLIVIDFIDMNEPHHQKDVENRLIEATRYDRARVQFAEISKFGLMEMSRQRLRPSLEESTGYICPRCHGNGMIRDLRSLALSIMRQIEQIALKQRSGEVQAEVPTEIAAFLLNEKREALVYLEQDSGTRITVLPHAHLESPNFSLHFNPDGFAPSSYERIVDVEEQQHIDRGYDVNWQTEPKDTKSTSNHWQQSDSAVQGQKPKNKAPAAKEAAPAPRQTVAWLSNLFAPKPEASLANTLNNQDAAAAIEAIVNTGAQSLGALGNLSLDQHTTKKPTNRRTEKRSEDKRADTERSERQEKPERSARNERQEKRSERAEKEPRQERSARRDTQAHEEKHPKREAGSRREPRAAVTRLETLTPTVSTAHSPDKATANTPAVSADDNAARADKGKKESKQEKSQQLSVRAIASDNATEQAPATVHLSLDASKGVPAARKKSSAPAVADNITAAEAHRPAAPIAPVTAAADGLSDVPSAAQLDKADDDNVSNKAQPAPQQAPAADTLALDDQLLSEIATAQGRAKNDPRVVYAAFVATVRSKTPADKPVAPAKDVTITGSAGDFVRAALSDADVRLQADGFAATFIAALAVARSVNDTPTADAALKNAPAFSFVNYGYGALSEDVLASFYAATSSSARHSQAQGKTDVPARPITARAKNDPRGQHPEYVADTAPAAAKANAATGSDLDAPAQATPTATDNDSEHSLAERLNTALEGALDAVSNTLTQAMDAVQETWQHITQEPVTNDVPAPQPSAPADTDPVAETPVETVAAVDADDGTSAPSHVDASDALPLNSDVMSSDVESDDVAADDSVDADETTKATKAPTEKKSASKKTSKDKKAKATNYKNMIENVAEQLLPQTGFLNLAAPKPVKVRIKKPKAEGSNKPKAEVRKKPKADAPTQDALDLTPATDGSDA